MVHVEVVRFMVLVGVYMAGDWVTVLRHGSHIAFV